MKSPIVLAAAVVATFAGCASTDAPTTQPTAPTELVYRTGSNIPVRDKTPLTKEEREKQREASQRMLENIQRSGPNPTKN